MKTEERIHQIKVQKCDRIAFSKGFRRGAIYWVAGIDWLANPDRGPLFVAINRKGRVEGFFKDECRARLRADNIPLDRMTRATLSHWRNVAG